MHQGKKHAEYVKHTNLSKEYADFFSIPCGRWRGCGSGMSPGRGSIDATTDIQKQSEL